MFALKIFDRDSRSATASVLTELATSPDLGVEIASYDSQGFGDLTSGIAMLEPRRKSMHLRHDAYSLLDLIGPNSSSALAELDGEMVAATQLRIGAGAVMHVARTAAAPHAWNAEIGEMFPVASGAKFEAVEAALRLAAPRVVPCGGLFVENTFESPDWHAALFRRLDGEPDRLQGVGLCLDIGHAKVWGGAPLSAWLDLCSDLVRAGRPVHAHVHTNDGLKDRHFTFPRGEEMGLLEPSPFCPGGLMPELRRLAALCGDDHCVLEVSTAGWRDNLDWVRQAFPTPAASPAP